MLQKKVEMVWHVACDISGELMWHFGVLQMGPYDHQYDIIDKELQSAYNDSYRKVVSFSQILRI